MLTIEEMTRLSQIFINLGITKIRLTGESPLVRRGIDDLIISLGKNKKLKELTLTTNGSQLDKKYVHIEKIWHQKNKCQSRQSECKELQSNYPRW